MESAGIKLKSELDGIRWCSRYSGKHDICRRGRGLRPRHWRERPNFRALDVNDRGSPACARWQHEICARYTPADILKETLEFLHIQPGLPDQCAKVPFANSLWFGTDRRLCGELVCRRMMWLPCWASISYPIFSNALYGVFAGDHRQFHALSTSMTSSEMPGGTGSLF